MDYQEKTLKQAVGNLEILISQYSDNEIMNSIVMGQNELFDYLIKGLNENEIDYLWGKFHPYTSYGKGSSEEIEFGLDELKTLKHNLSFGFFD